MRTACYPIRKLTSMRRSLRFNTYDDVLADAKSLVRNGYEREGSWSLGQVCSHLNETVEKSIDGFPEMKPWPVRFLARTFVLKGILQHRQHFRRFPAPPYLMPKDMIFDATGVEVLGLSFAR